MKTSSLRISLREIILLCKEICGNKYVFTDDQSLTDYGSDQTLNLFFKADIIVKPGSTEEVASVVKICNIYNIPLTPRGGGSGVTGGALPKNGGIILSLERLNKIITINEIDGYVIAEAGVITSELCSEVEKVKLCFPIPPSSSLYSYVGGNVAENAGSINSCKYGTTANFVLNLEVVLPTGEIIWTGSNIRKNSTGLNLTQLFVGSEGILGIITKVVYKLIPKLKEEVFLLAGFKCLQDACAAVIAIKQSGVSPSSVELIGKNALQLTSNFLNEKLPLVDKNINSHLLIGLEEANIEMLTINMELVGLILERFAEENVVVGFNAEEKKRMSKIRFSIGLAMTSNGKTYRDIDACVPLSSLFDYLLKVESICKKYVIPLVYFGHALDGNVHTMLLIDKKNAFQKSENLRLATDEIFKYAILKGGVISGEHGIGLLQNEFMQFQFSESQLTLMKNIKKLLDPNSILNIGKVF